MIKTYKIALDVDVDDIVDSILQYLDDALGEAVGCNDTDWIPEEIYNEMVSDILARVKERAVI